jgi:signal transduction histidine kinase
MKSIKTKIWLSILGVTTLVIVIIWFSQVVLLEQFYTAGKRHEMIGSAGNIVSMVANADELPQDELKQLCAENNYCLEFYFPDYRSTIRFEPIGSGNLMRDELFERQSILIELQSMDPGTFLETRQQSSFGTEYNVVASYNQSKLGNYVLMVASELAPVREAVSTIRSQLVVLTIGLLLFATVLALVLSNSLTRPILKISNAAKEVAKGDLQVQVNVKATDEIGQLAEDFNQMVREIDRSNTLQRELVANVSHDIRTPLTMIQGYAEMIRDLTGDNREKRNEQLGVIIAETNRLNTLVNDILDLSRLQAGRQPIHPAPFDLGVKLRDVLKRYDLLEASEGFTFTLEAPEHVWVMADEIKMEQVLFNIINNATNHTGADKKVMIRALDRGQAVRVEIADTGAGIHPEDLPLIWERYYKPYKKKDRKGMGTGLGLSIVKAILVAHHFAYGVDSVLGKGSTFWFEITKTKEPDKQAKPSLLPKHPTA